MDIEKTAVKDLKLSTEIVTDITGTVDAYTKEETDTLLSDKASASELTSLQESVTALQSTVDGKQSDLGIVSVVGCITDAECSVSTSGAIYRALQDKASTTDLSTLQATVDGKMDYASVVCTVVGDDWCGASYRIPTDGAVYRKLQEKQDAIVITCDLTESDRCDSTYQVPTNGAVYRALQNKADTSNLTSLQTQVTTLDSTSVKWNDVVDCVQCITESPVSSLGVWNVLTYGKSEYDLASANTLTSLQSNVSSLQTEVDSMNIGAVRCYLEGNDYVCDSSNRWQLVTDGAVYRALETNLTCAKTYTNEAIAPATIAASIAADSTAMASIIAALPVYNGETEDITDGE